MLACYKHLCLRISVARVVPVTDSPASMYNFSVHSTILPCGSRRTCESAALRGAGPAPRCRAARPQPSMADPPPRSDATCAHTRVFMQCPLSYAVCAGTKWQGERHVPCPCSRPSERCKVAHGHLKRGAQRRRHGKQKNQHGDSGAWHMQPGLLRALTRTVHAHTHAALALTPTRTPDKRNLLAFRRCFACRLFL